jgi:hypothetical protein
MPDKDVRQLGIGQHQQDIGMTKLTGLAPARQVPAAEFREVECAPFQVVLVKHDRLFTPICRDRMWISPLAWARDIDGFEAIGAS